MPPNETLGQGLKIGELCQDDITNTLVFFVNGEFENMFPSFLNINIDYISAGLSSLGVPGVPWQPLILADQLTLSQPRGQIMPTK
jgi:hypothetical protein